MNRKHGRNIFLRRKSGDSDQDFDKSRETVRFFCMIFFVSDFYIMSQFIIAIFF